jgi:DNA-binding transcriptional ArsR family regulator
MKVTELHRVAGKAAALLKALGHDRRLMIVCELASGERTVGELEKVVGLSQSALSQHLARLRKEGIVTTRREAHFIHYALANEEAQRIVEVLAGLYCPGSKADLEAAGSDQGQGSPGEQAPEVQSIMVEQVKTV